MRDKIYTLAVAGALLTGVWAQAVTLDLVPSNTSVKVGDLFQVELRIWGLGESTTPSLGAYDITLAYNPAVLGFSSFIFGDLVLGNQLDLEGFGTVSGLNSGTVGQLSAFEISLDLASDLDALQAGGFGLGRIMFNGLANGASGLRLTSGLFSDAAGNALSVQVRNGTEKVPEPVSGGLLIAASVAFALSTQHMKRTRAGRDHG